MKKEGWTNERRAIDIDTFSNQPNTANPSPISRGGFSRMTSQEIWQLNQKLLDEQRPAEMKNARKMEQAKMAFKKVFQMGQEQDQKKLAEMKLPPKKKVEKGKKDGHSLKK